MIPSQTRPVLKRPLALMGFPCSGKTTLGSLLASALELPWLDSDAEITQQSGHPPAYWLQTLGEPAFREIELAWLLAWQPAKPCILSTGGGLPCYRDNLTLLQTKALTVYLELDFKTLQTRLNTPPSHALTKLYAPAELERLFAQRAEIYQQADLRLSVKDSPEQLLAQLLDLLASQTTIQT